MFTVKGKMQPSMIPFAEIFLNQAIIEIFLQRGIDINDWDNRYEILHQLYADKKKIGFNNYP